MLNKLNIAHRLSIGFGVKLLLIACLGGFSLYCGQTIGTAIEDFKRLRNKEVLAEQVQKGVFESRYRMWAFLGTGKAQFYQEGIDELLCVREHLSELAAMPRHPPERSALMAELDRAIVTYGWEKAPQFFAARSRGVAAESPEMQGLVAEGNAIGDVIGLKADQITESIRAKTTLSGDKATTGVAEIIWLSMLMGAISLLLGGALALKILRSVVVPIKGLAQTMTAMAEGDLQQALPNTNKHDEIGAMAESLVVFRDGLSHRQELAAASAAEQIARDARANAIERLTRDFNQSLSAMVETVTNAVNDLEATAALMTANCQQATEQATTVSAVTEDAAASVQTAAAAAERLAASINEIAGQVQLSSRATRAAFDEAIRTKETVAGLSENSARIGDVVNLISGIAQKTNLLALNAAIEAAQAGDAGKGFAVVAGEVKNLASQTATATEQIGAQIAAIQATTQSAVEAIAAIFSRIEEISQISAAINVAVEEQSHATIEIARNVKQAATGTQEVSVSIGEVTEASTATGFAAGQVLFTTHELTQETEVLQEAVAKFLDSVRAA